MVTRVTQKCQKWMMRSVVVFSLVIAVLGFGTIPVETQQPEPNPLAGEFRIGPEDVLDISVWGDEALNSVVPVRPDGKISMPLVSDVHAAGLTPTQLREVLVKRLSEYLAKPHVSVIVKEVHSFKVSVLGEVKTPGRYEVKSQASVLDVLAQAGGFSEFASRSRILILRSDGKTLKRIPFDYEKFVSANGNKDKQNFDIQPGDIVVVP
jgi:polysaccharide biosynthesis/export protein